MTWIRPGAKLTRPRMRRGVAKDLSRVRFVGLDIDGVLTDGGVFLGEDGVQRRRFDIKDGLGLVRFVRSGGVVAIISSSSATSGIDRLKGFGIEDVYTGVVDKREVLRDRLAHHGIASAEAAYMGDDLPDLGCLAEVGVPAAPSDSVAEVRAIARFVSSRPGGYGAVRELMDHILLGRGVDGHP